MSTVDAWTRSVSTPVRVQEPPAGAPSAPGRTPSAVGITPAGGLPTFTPQRHATLWVVGAHGGAGETTLAGLLPGARAADHQWPVTDAGRYPVVLMCRTHAAGLLAAQAALQQLAAGGAPGVHLLGLVLSADVPGRLPRPLRDLERLVAGGVAPFGKDRVWRLPYLEAWRLGEPETSDVARLAGQLAPLLTAR